MNETTTAQTMAVLAELVLMANRLNLPMPLYLTASEKNSQLNLTLNNRADLEAWHQVFGGGRLWECAPTASSPSVLVTNMHSGSMLGWSVNLQANVPLPLSPEVLAALGEAARSDAAAVLVAEAVAVLDDCTCDLNLRQVCNACQAVPAPVKDLPATKPKRYLDSDSGLWEEHPDDPALLLRVSAVTGETTSSTWKRRTIQRDHGPLVEVTP